jgi:hypothetical protein
MPNLMLQSVLENIKTESDDDYGWLEPNGTYHPVEWGKHAEWAMNWLNEHYPYREHADVYWVTINGKRKHVVAGDCLMYRFGWCLLDSPYQGVANPHYNSTKGLTKAQKEFLYDYYIQRNMHDRASAVYKDDSNVIPIINGI